MTRFISLVAAMFIIVTVGPAQGTLSWVNLSDVSIQQLDADSYRLRVAVDWAAEDMQWEWVPFEEYPTPPPISTAGSFNFFSMTLLGSTQYNPTQNAVGWSDFCYNAPGLWQDEAYYNWGPWQAQPFDETVFGYDFDLAEPSLGPFSLSYNATVDWSFRYDAIYHPYYRETHSGDFAAMVIPEPASLILVGLGAAAIGFRMRRRTVSSR
ncbi:MAG: PEP-CTERM sorting domain-containing protein [candidate division Zixibacteria bacterium]|nr:PEP-CTERM sorting domain-containing protein [candidate division Zixibacteria bacterium]